jgi:uncharacterized protein YecE (DUF72 family)
MEKAMAQFHIGTAGWSYQDWEGIVYPAQKSTGFHALVFLADYINLVEINSTFYRPPVMRVALAWVKKVQHRPDFLFAVKLHQNFTHGERRFTQKETDEFKLGIEPLRSHSRLGAILIQFPWSFKDSGMNREHLERIFRAFRDYPLALEVRHGSWNRPDFFLWLQSNKVGFCNIDQPVINDSLSPTSIQTHPDFTYVRLHGRNYQNWFSQSAGRDARYNYLYGGEELDEWVERIKGLGEKSRNVFVVTNNHYQGQALANALQIKNKLTGEKVDIPLDLIKRYPLLRKIVKKIEKGQIDLFE